MGREAVNLAEAVQLSQPEEDWRPELPFHFQTKGRTINSSPFHKTYSREPVKLALFQIKEDHKTPPPLYSSQKIIIITVSYRECVTRLLTSFFHDWNPSGSLQNRQKYFHILLTRYSNF